MISYIALLSPSALCVQVFQLYLLRLVLFMSSIHTATHLLKYINLRIDVVSCSTLAVSILVQRRLYTDITVFQRRLFIGYIPDGSPNRF